jgi:hypothetical protein
VILPCSGGGGGGCGGWDVSVEWRPGCRWCLWWGWWCCEGVGNSQCCPRVGLGGRGELLFQGEDVLGGRGGFLL